MAYTRSVYSSSLLPAILQVLASTILLILHGATVRAHPSPCSNRPICGSISIPYPFWIIGHDPSCGLPDYRILCNSTIPFLVTDSGQFQILEFDEYKNQLSINSSSLRVHPQSCNGANTSPSTLSFTLTNRTAPFAISDTNAFVVMGCHSYGRYSGSSSLSRGLSYSFSCQAGCSEDICSISPSLFSGVVPLATSPCCFSWLPRGLTQIYLEVAAAGDSEGCGVATISNPQSADFATNSYSVDIIWGFMFESTSQNCSTVSNTSGYACSQHANCNEIGFHMYTCVCSSGYYGDGLTCTAESSSIRLLDVSVLLSVYGLPIGGFLLLFCLFKSRATRRRRRRYFRLHGGHRLQELLPGIQGQVTPKLFRERELEKASQKFSETMKLGSGGYGTVYKGILTDGLVVAIKKSNRSQQPAEADQFLNEIILCSNIRHRNIVQLLGCCLEAQVPILIYEYIPNGTLSDHLRGKFDDNLGWETRLRIARQTADALAYLHSSASPPIIHRDIKSSNILLDHDFTPKIADFGASRLRAPDETHVSTAVLGTFGYLDPEYFETFRLSDKSDVYSFGMVLLELITSLSPVAMGSNQSLLCKEKLRTGEFSQLVDAHLKASMPAEEMSSVDHVAEIALNCLSIQGHSRPSMREVADELYHIHLSSSICTHANSNFSDAASLQENKRPSLLVARGILTTESAFGNEGVIYGKRCGS